jgi:hypothetical protein
MRHLEVFLTAEAGSAPIVPNSLNACAFWATTCPLIGETIVSGSIFGDAGFMTMSGEIDTSRPIPRHWLGEGPNWSLGFGPIATITI